MLSKDDLAILAIGVAFIAAAGYVAYCETDRKNQPRYEPTFSMASLNVECADQDTGDHYFHPNYSVPGQTQIFMNQRYPTISGHNISTLIHQGLSALNRPAPQDDDWRIRPPGEVMWLCPKPRQKERLQVPVDLTYSPVKLGRCLCGVGWALAWQWR
jgi:hypothetical protein